jgi:chromosome segregation ATPase
MLNFELISTLIGILGGTGALVAGIAYGISCWRNGGNQYKEELIKDLKNTVQQRECVITQLNQDKTNLIINHQKQITDLQKELSKLQEIVEEQSRKLKQYADILENRDPQTLEILQQIKDEMAKLNQHQIFQEKNVEMVKSDLKNKKTNLTIKEEV